MKKIIVLFALLNSSASFSQDFALIGKDSIEYEITRHGEPWIVMVSGVGGDLDAFQEVRDFLARETTVLCYSRSGLGKSTYNNGTKSFDSTIDELKALLDTLNAPDNIILGAHSFGGLIVRAYATKYPEGIKGIVSVDPAVEDLLEALARIYPDAKEYFTSLYYPEDYEKYPKGENDDVNSMFEVWNNPDKWESWFNVPSNIPQFLLSSTKIIPQNKSRASEELMQARYDAQRRTLIDSQVHMQIVIPDAGHYLQNEKAGITFDTFMMMLNICR
jgi:pimeloyl-ACP methyl ester carboxylesterase